MAIKSEKTCTTCRFDTDNECAKTNCLVCPVCECDYKNDHYYCRCLNVKDGDECPYYSPVPVKKIHTKSTLIQRIKKLLKLGGKT